MKFHKWASFPKYYLSLFSSLNFIIFIRFEQSLKHSNVTSFSSITTLKLGNFIQEQQIFFQAQDFGPEKTCRELATLPSAARIQYILSPGASWEGENAAVSSTPPGIRS